MACIFYFLNFALTNGSSLMWEWLFYNFYSLTTFSILRRISNVCCLFCFDLFVCFFLKENQKLLQNVTSRSFARLQIQHRRFFKNMSNVWEDFTKKQSSFNEAVKKHTALMAEQEKIAVGLEEDINVLTEGFLHHIGITSY